MRFVTLGVVALVVGCGGEPKDDDVLDDTGAVESEDDASDPELAEIEVLLDEAVPEERS